MKQRIAILGAGSWGVTLAHLLHTNGHSVTLWEFSKIQAQQLRIKRQLPVLPHLLLPSRLFITHDIAEACTSSTVILFAVPSQNMRSTLELLSHTNIDIQNISAISATKGIENNTFFRMSQVITDVIPQFLGKVTVISGPSHAEEVSKKIPTTVVAASPNQELAEQTQQLLMNKYFRVYTNTDIVGVEIGGAFKNILAIACGIGDGLSLGDNSKAALITRGLAEMIRFGMNFGAQKETFAGLSGIGDLVVTCTSRHSRNRLFGEKIGRGLKTEQALKEMVMVAEGVPTTKAVYELSKKNDIELPITNQVYAVLYKNKSPQKAIAELMTRKPKPE